MSINVLMLNYEFPPIGGGAANAHYCILKEFAKIPSLIVDVLTSASAPGFVEERFAENITVHKVGLHKKDLHYWRKSEVIEWLIKAKGPYRRLIKKNNYDLVHAFFGFPSGYLCYKTRKRLPYIISLRGSDVPGQNQRLQFEYKLLAPLFKKIWSNASAIAACSEGLRQRALKFFPDVRISSIPNGVDLASFKSGSRRGIAKPLRLITVGRLSPTKRMELLIESIKLLRERGIDVQLKVVGGGSLEQKLRQMVSQQGLDSTIEFTGRVDAGQMPRLYQESDIYVSATMQEGMSNAMLEAMACGLPIVTTQCEGLDELISDNGIIVKDANADKIAQSVQKLVADTSIYEKMCAAAVRKTEKFRWDIVATKYRELYGEISLKQHQNC